MSAGRGSCFGISVITACVVSSIPATEPGVLQSGTGHLRRVDNPPRHQIRVIAPVGVKPVIVLAVAHIFHHHLALVPRVAGNGVQRFLQRALHQPDAQGYVARHPPQQVVQRRLGPQQANPAAGNDALLNRRPRGRQRILGAALALVQLRLRSRAHLDHRHPAGQIRQPFLQLLPVVIRGRVLNLHPQLGNPPGNGPFPAAPFYNRSLVFGRHQPPRRTQLLH